MNNKNVTSSNSLDIANIVIEEIQKTIDKNKEQAYRNLVNNIKKDTEQFVPYKTGNLAKNVQDTPKGYMYAENYASYALNPIAPSGKPKNYTKNVHMQAQGNTVDVSEREFAKKWADQYAKDLLQGLVGK